MSKGRTGRVGGIAVVFFKPASVAFLGSDTYLGSSSSPRRGVLITVNTRLVAGGSGAAWGSRGSNDGGQWPRPQEGGLLVVIPCYLCRGHGGQLHPLSRAHTHTHSHTQTAAARSILCLPLGEKWEERSKQRGVFAQAHTTPHPSQSSLCLSPHLLRRHNHSSLSSFSLSPSLHPLGCIGPVAVQRRYNPLTPLNDPEVECSSWMPMGPAGLTPAGAG